MKTRLNILISTLISITLISCSENAIEEHSEEVNYLFELESTQTLDNPILYGKTLDLISVSKKSKLLNEIEFDIENITISKYKDSEFNSIVIPQLLTKNDKISYSLVTYSLENKIMNDYLIIRIEEIGDNIYNTQYINSSDQLIGEITVQDSVVISAKSYSTNSKETWNQCIKRAIDRMSSGTTAGNIEALLCFAFGPSCAAGTAIGCLGVALFY